MRTWFQEGQHMTAKSRMKKLRKACTGLLAFGVVVATVGIDSGLANAAIQDYYVLSGNFAGDAREEAFYYQPGTGEDDLVRFGIDGNGALVTVVTSFTVNGTYDPIVGDFDADPYDEILWYAPGTAADFFWNFTSFTNVSSTPYKANGLYEPVSGDFNGDGWDDIVWY